MLHVFPKKIQIVQLTVFHVQYVYLHAWSMTKLKGNRVNNTTIANKKSFASHVCIYILNPTKNCTETTKYQGIKKKTVSFYIFIIYVNQN